ncbi:hypothetical protein KCU65_g5489, partial [Aureobasidium melanogenum]
MSLTNKEAEFEDLWEQMEELAELGDKADMKLARAIARHLVTYAELPSSYGIRAHLALASLVCARDALHEAEENEAKTQVRIPSELQAELQTIREAYKSKETKEVTVIEGDVDAEVSSASTLPTTLQLGLGTQEEPIDLTLEHDPTSFEYTSSKPLVNPACDHVGGTKVRSTGFSLWPRSKHSYTRPQSIPSK